MIRKQSRQVTFSRRKAAALKQVIALFARYDRLAAERWLDLISDEQKTKEPGAATQISQERAEFLAQLAFQLAKTNPDEAQKLGVLSLGGKEIPWDFGRLLIALKSSHPSKSEALFQAAIAAMRRNGSSGRSTLGLLSNYLFFNNGALFNPADAANARLFIDYVLEAASIQIGLVRDAVSKNAPMPESAANLTSFLDLDRSFSLLEAAIKVINQIQIGLPAPTSLKPRPRIRVISITMVGGAELTTGYHATLDSLSFQELAELVRSDYFRSRNLGDGIHNKVVRARYLLNLGQSVLNLDRPPSQLSLEQLLP